MRHTRGLRAFMLIELLVATFVLSLLIMGLYVIFYKSHSVWERGNRRLEQYQTARGCLDTLSRELKSTFMSASNPSIVFRGKEDEISFTCASNMPQEIGEYDLKQIHYQLRSYQLIRKVRSNWGNSLNPGGTNVLASQIESLTFSYYTGKLWQPEWDSQKDTNTAFGTGLPQAVCVELVVRGEGELPVTFSITIDIPTK